MPPGSKCSSPLSIFARYQLQVRLGSKNHLLRCGYLSQIFFCSVFSRMEEMRLTWIRNNQTVLHASSYRTVQDATGPNDLADVTRRIILPHTHTGSPRYYAHAYNDCIAIVR